jgi:hypothetical protein
VEIWSGWICSSDGRHKKQLQGFGGRTGKRTLRRWIFIDWTNNIKEDLNTDLPLNALIIMIIINRRRCRLSRIRPLGLFRFRAYFSETYGSIGSLVGLLGRGIGPTQDLCLHTRQLQHRKTRIHIRASSGIRTHDSSVRTCLRLLSHWDRQML